MRFFFALALWGGAVLCVAVPVAHAEFLVSSAILEFHSGGPPQKDIELIGRGSGKDYIVTEVNEIRRPGAQDEAHQLVENPGESYLLVTPDKTILPAGSRKVLRFVLLKPLDAQEHIYRVAVKPVIKDVANNAALGLKVLIGYEVLVILRPAVITPNYHVERHGRMLTVRNDGNSNVLLQNGQQCKAQKCPLPPVIRVYPGQSRSVELPRAQPVTYTVWDGIKNEEQHF